MAEMVKFLKGYLKDLPSTRVDGTIYFVLPDPVADKDKEGYNSVGRLYVGDTLIAETNVTDSGSVDALVKAVIAELDATAEGTGTNGIKVKVVEVDGKLTEVTIDDNVLASYKTKQTAKSGTGSTVKTVTGYTQNENGEVEMTFEDIAFPTDENTQYHVEYDSANKVIKLVEGMNKDKMEIDASDFIKDGMISSVELVAENAEGTKGQFLKITWNDDGEDVTYVDVTTLVDVYSGKDGISVDGYSIGHTNKIDAGSTSASSGALNHGDSITLPVVNYDANGHITSVSTTTVTLPAATDISGKADKVVGATEGNFASLDANGNLTDSGKKASDFVSSEGYVAYSQAEKDKLEGIETGAEVNQVIATGSSNGTISVDGTDVAVKGLADAAYATVDSLNATAKGYADAVQGNTKVTVEEVVNALNTMNDKVGTVDSDNKAALGEISNIIEMLTWGSF